MAPNPSSGTAEPSEPTKNRTAESSKPPLRPKAVEMGPATAAPITQPSNAQETAQPDRLPRAASDKFCGVMKLASIALTAPEITAVSYPNRNPPSDAMNARPTTRRSVPLDMNWPLPR